MASLNDDEAAAALANDTSKTLCNLSALDHAHSSNPYIPAWYLQVRFLSSIVSFLGVGLLSRKAAGEGWCVTHCSRR